MLLIIAYTVSYLAMVILTVKVTGSDPSDPTIALHRLAQLAEKNNMARLDFDPNDYDFQCQVCDSYILGNSKHCKHCNRCCYEFDHHCDWISNDIGLHNYIDFIRMLVSIVATNLLQIGASAFALATISNEESDIQIGVLMMN